MFRGLLFICAVLFSPAIASSATVYQTPYSGQLSESGTPVNGTRYITLKLYDQEVGGTLIRSQPDSLVLIGGVYHTLLATSLEDWTGDRWIGVTVNSGSELSPRVFVGSAPRAIRAEVADQLLHPTLVGSNTNTGLAFLAGNAWTKIDSVTFVTATTGKVVIFVTGYVEPNGQGFWGVQYAVNSGAPIGHATAVGFLSVTASTTPMMSVAMTQLDTISTPGPQKYYLWAKLTAAIVPSLHHFSPMVYQFTPTP